MSKELEHIKLKQLQNILIQIVKLLGKFPCDEDNKEIRKQYIEIVEELKDITNE